MTKVADSKLSSEGERNFLWARAHMGRIPTRAEK